MAEVQPKHVDDTTRLLPGEGEDFPKGYVPSDKEDYMDEKQLAYFRALLLDWRQSLEEELAETIQDLQTGNSAADLNDVASSEYDQGVELRTRDRERKLIKKIEKTLKRIEEDDFGFCDQCGIEIGIRRLEARPTADLCIDCKTMAEIKEKQLQG